MVGVFGSFGGTCGWLEGVECDVGLDSGTSGFLDACADICASIR